MNIPAHTLNIYTLGRFSIADEEKSFATDWPDEATKVFFCSLLSPLDIYFSWDRICRSMLGVPETRASRRQLEETIIRPLITFLTREVGFNPLIINPEGISIDKQGINIDALEFYNAVLEGLRLLSLDNYPAALEKFTRANVLYAGSYLPGISGKIIDNTRADLESLYRTAVMEGLQPVTDRPARTLRHAPVSFLRMV
jgi:hypothetical protein